MNFTEFSIHGQRAELERQLRSAELDATVPDLRRLNGSARRQRFIDVCARFARAAARAREAEVTGAPTLHGRPTFAGTLFISHDHGSARSGE